MRQAELEAAIREANRIFGRGYRPEKAPPESREPESGRDTESAPCQFLELREWPPESQGADQRFGQPHAKLFPFIGRKVRTPEGPGMLLQVFADRVTVVLDSQVSRSSVFHPCEIEPVSPE